MLRELHVRNFALIDELTVSLGPGLNLLTGETGAGKSILVDALTLLLGARASTEDVRGGRSRAALAARFALPAGGAVRARLRAMGIEADDELVIRREIPADGGTRAYLNGQPATVAMLRSVGEALVEVHGQHEGLRLLQPAAHLDLLDAFAGADAALLGGRVEALARQREHLRQEAQRLRDGERERARRVDMLAYQVREIDAAAPQVGEPEALQARRLTLAHAERLREEAEAAYDAVYAAEGTSAADRLRDALRALRDAGRLDPGLAPLVRQLEDAATLVAEAARDLRRYGDALVADPDALRAVEDRLHLLGMLTRKYGEGIEDVLRYRDAAAAELADLGRADERLAGIEGEVAEIEAALGEAAGRLSHLRRAAAERLRRAAERELAALGMGRAAFAVEIARVPDPDGVVVDGAPVAVGGRGIDQVQFLIAPNAGEPPRALHRIASGGELSRLMLALRTVLVEQDPVPTVVFDEVDAGIGARAAAPVGERLAALARRHQVICITHLAQLASLAQVHLLVYKELVDGRTRIRVRSLDAASRVREVARMLGGESRVAREHAQELLRAARRVRSGAQAGTGGGKINTGAVEAIGDRSDEGA